MANMKRRDRLSRPPFHLGVAQITVSGFKSIREEQAIEIRPLTILAGANSSGKSSMIQPLLLLKQTLEASFDPGPLLLYGPNVRFSSIGQLFSRSGSAGSSEEFTVGLKVGNGLTFRQVFRRNAANELVIGSIAVADHDKEWLLSPDMASEEVSRIAEIELGDFVRDWQDGRFGTVEWAVDRDRCFLELQLFVGRQGQEKSSRIPLGFVPARLDFVQNVLREIIHVPGVRGNPERTYNRTGALGPLFPGRFDSYVASVVHHWQQNSDPRLRELEDALQNLGLTSTIRSKAVDDISVELHVGRVVKTGSKGDADLDNIADVGFGVSQSLPVLVALLAAERDQLVYIEQPELHLHPRAQVALADELVRAAKRGVRIVIETHSSLILLGVQTAVAERRLPSNLVKLHWFTRNPRSGGTTVVSSDLDDTGAFDEDWPEDFADVTLELEGRYLNAATLRTESSKESL